MAGRLLFNIYTLLMLSCVKSCFPPESIQVSVPQTIPAGYVISKVNVDNCDTKSLHFTLSDPDFTATSDGTIVSTVMVTFRGQTFSVRAQDASGQNSEMKVNLVHNRVQKRMVADRFLKRSKRRWSPPPFSILENGPPPFPQDLGLIGSDSQAKYSVYYIISGPGVTENPVGVFSVEKDTGMLRIHKSLDREEFPMIVFVARVLNTVSHTDTDNPLNVTVNVEDVNDNSPQFASPLQYTVLEHCQLGTVVGAVKATDRDQENTLHTKIKYTLLPGQNLFSIHPDTGIISTAAVNLDREVQEKHFATVLIQDMYGETSRSLSSTGTATILLGDINDNPPTFSKTSYIASIEENKSDQCILRIPVEDKDLINTPNWNSAFLITQGNENNNFRIERDPKTNEGLLYVVKPLDFERQQSHRLMVKARNTADLTNTKADWPSVPVNVSVVNVDEGPEFTARTVLFIIKENTANGTLIGTYTALDPETKSGTGIKYYKTSDPASWVKVDMNTGQLRVANTIDRESHFVQDGIYNVTMKAVDASSKTGTGTVIIVVEDVNDNMPELPTGELVLCEKAGELVSLPIVAKDLDQSPFSAPFSFELGDKSEGKWTVKKINDTAAILQQTKELPTGLYIVPVAAKDLQGFGRTQMVHVRICQCRNGACVTKPKSILLGPLAILAMLLPLLLLLLLGILLALFCVTKEEKRDLLDMGDSGGVLLKSNIEAPGEEVDSRLILDSTDGIEQKKDMQLNSGWIGNKSTSTIGRHSALDNGLLQSSGAIMADSQNAFFSSQYGNQFGTGQFGGNRFGATNVSFNHGQLFQDSSVYKTWQTNGRYIQEKLVYLGSDAEDRYADDIIHSYGYEGRGSAAGSVGCCSDQGNDDNLDFINTLGPKFKTLAEVCTKIQ